MFSPYCVEFGSILCVWRSSSMYFLWIGFFCVWLQALFFEFHVFYSTLNLRCCSLRTSYWLFCTAIGIFGAVVMKENLHIRLTTILFVTQLICWWLRIEIYWMFYGTISCVWTGQDGFNKWNNFQTKCLLNHFEVSRALIFSYLSIADWFWQYKQLSNTYRGESMETGIYSYWRSFEGLLRLLVVSAGLPVCCLNEVVSCIAFFALQLPLEDWLRSLWNNTLCGSGLGCLRGCSRPF